MLLTKVTRFTLLGVFYKQIQTPEEICTSERSSRFSQWVESVFDTMKGQLTLEDHGGRTIPGVYSRVAGRLLALAAGIWHNWLIGELNKRSLIADDHEDSLI